MTHHYVDGSRYQGTPDFHAAKASGLTGVVWNVDDPGFVSRIREAHAAGLSVGAYHFTATGVGSGAQAAQYALSICAPVLDLLVFVAGDHESGNGDLTNWILDYQRALRSAVGTARAWVYSGSWWLAAHIRKDATELASYPLWDAAYGAAKPAPPRPWTSISMWQHTDKANVPGFAGPVDESFTDFNLGSTHNTQPGPSAAAFSEDDDVQARLLYRGVIQIMFRLTYGRDASPQDLDWWENLAKQKGAGGYEWALTAMLNGDGVGPEFGKAIDKLHAAAS